MAETQVQSETTSQTQSQKDSEITLSIKTLQEESLQISELSEMERNYAVEVISLMRQLIEPLNTSFRIKPASIAKNDSSLEDVVLTPQGMVLLIHNNGMIYSRPLETLQTETVVKILVEIVPAVKSLLVEKRQKIGGRVSVLEKVAREFRKVVTSLPTKKVAQPQHVAPQSKEKAGSQDAMKSAFTEQ